MIAQRGSSQAGLPVLPAFTQELPEVTLVTLEQPHPGFTQRQVCQMYGLSADNASRQKGFQGDSPGYIRNATGVDWVVQKQGMKNLYFPPVGWVPPEGE
ncbi:hypothetical protein DO97_03755 [Neosynechococcus sphagnicola sy1]|uniref:Uncharacterized protein n=1 Tax=Neosynechococcus sphagnicola sy1 TaxID=1497020 RepID=A0A098TLV6_9CYAN|nr:hypothetical protein [Neosynechococcus sphagnicola]KGF72852.1 hypothetical protein DO97_03755 [Neosynechococcus sphagnicola sy1]